MSVQTTYDINCITMSVLISIGHQGCYDECGERRKGGGDAKPSCPGYIYILDPWSTWHPSTWSLEFPQGLQRHSEKFAPSLPQLLSAAFSDLAISFTNSNNCIHTRPQSTRKLARAIARLLLDRGGGALLARPQRRISSWCGTSSVMGQQLSEGVLMSAMLPRFGE